MTVKDALSVLNAEKIYIGWDGNLNLFDRQNELMMDAFGQYRVKEIARGFEENSAEIRIAAIPAKEKEYE